MPDLMANEAMFAMTSGRASNMMRRTPIGQVTLSSSKPSSNFVRRLTLLTNEVQGLGDYAAIEKATVVHNLLRPSVPYFSIRSGRNHYRKTYLDLPMP